MKLTPCNLFALLVTGTVFTSMHGSMVNAEQPSKSVNQQASIVDVALNSEGTLKGKIVNARQELVPGTEVIITQGTKEIARTSSDEQGIFTVKDLEQGLYKVSSSNGSTYFRVWEATLAPPAAQEHAILVSDPQLVRGQTGPFGGGMMGGGGGGGLGTLFTLGTIAGAGIGISEGVNNSNDEQLASP